MRVSGCRPGARRFRSVHRSRGKAQRSQPGCLFLAGCPLCIDQDLRFTLGALVTLGVDFCTNHVPLLRPGRHRFRNNRRLHHPQAPWCSVAGDATITNDNWEMFVIGARAESCQSHHLEKTTSGRCRAGCGSLRAACARGFRRPAVIVHRQPVATVEIEIMSWHGAAGPQADGFMRFDRQFAGRVVVPSAVVFASE